MELSITKYLFTPDDRKLLMSLACTAINLSSQLTAVKLALAAGQDEAKADIKDGLEQIGAMIMATKKTVEDLGAELDLTNASLETISPVLAKIQADEKKILDELASANDEPAVAALLTKAQANNAKLKTVVEALAALDANVAEDEPDTGDGG